MIEKMNERIKRLREAGRLSDDALVALTKRGLISEKELSEMSLGAYQDYAEAKNAKVSEETAE